MHSFLMLFPMHSYSNKNALVSYSTCSNEDLHAHKASTKNHLEYAKKHESFMVLTSSMMSNKEGKR